MSLGEAVIRLEQERDAALKELRGVKQALKNLEERTLGDLGILDPSKLADAEAAPLLVWSTMRLPTGTCLANGVFRMFTTSLGAIGQGYESGLSRSETNMLEGGRIPSGLPSRIFAVGVEIRGGSDTDTQEVRRHLTLAWDFAQTRVDVGPVGSPFFKWDQTGRLGACRLGAASAGDWAPPKPVALFSEEKMREHGIEDRGLTRPAASCGTGGGVLLSSGMWFGVALMFGSRAPFHTDQEMSIRVSLAYEHQGVCVG